MCHDDDSRPPPPPTVGAVASHGRLTLAAGDGNTVAAYRAIPQDPRNRNVVLLPDVRGLHRYYRQLAVRFAEAGFTTAAIDYFGRSHGTGDRGDDFDWRSAVAEVRPEHVAADVRAAADHLHALNGGPVFTVGFCFGGSHSWRLAAGDIDLAGCIGFYGTLRHLTDVEDRLHRPLLMLVAGADELTPVADFRAFRQRLSDAGVDHRMHVYENAPHSFFDRSFVEWSEFCQDAWERILEFTSEHA
ncbi:dienelactone hydrolase family protein [Pseudonocardia ailaonensis]|uniref:Dienelactone hydrolase family protein n=1 Tax=Pseudonocardia ailaonensis TaxID=367279 RepID=A0ABN2N408_9PSEU